MVNTKKNGLKRLLALLLCAVCLCGVFPSQAFAASAGQKASSWLGGEYAGSDGQHYYSPAPYTYLVYNSDGTMVLFFVYVHWCFMCVCEGGGQIL